MVHATRGRAAYVRTLSLLCLWVVALASQRRHAGVMFRCATRVLSGPTDAGMGPRGRAHEETLSFLSLTG